MSKDVNSVPCCVKCTAHIWGDRIGYFMLNKVTENFDLYCESCWKLLFMGKDTI